MPIYCCVPHCKSKSNLKETSFHEFPIDTELRNAWLKAISREDFTPNDRSCSSKVCGLHFKDSDFIQHATRRNLKKGAIPTIFKGYPSYMTIPLKSERRVLKRKQDVNDIVLKKKQKVADTEAADLLLHFSNSVHDDLEIQCSSPGVQNDFANPDQSKTSDSQSAEIKRLALINKNQSDEIKRLRRLVTARNKKIKLLRVKLEKTVNEVNYWKKDAYVQSINKFKILSEYGYADKHQEFILNQLSNFDKKIPRWPHNILRECVLWHASSPKGYEAVRNRKLLILPSTRTLKRFTGPVNGEVGFTDLIKTRLIDEAAQLKPEEKFASLVIDEMAIKPQCVYDSKLDCFFGSKSETSATSSDVYDHANRLLCFLLYGLSTKFCIPCGYYFTKQLTGKELYSFTIDIIKEVEACGFILVRIVTDNLSVNVNLFKEFAGGNLKTSIPHPCDPGRQLFFAFDQNHIIKNIRSLFLEKEMTDGTEIISGKYLKQLYRIQKDEKIKAVRNLTIKHVLPTNLEKMNVARAVLIFSPPVVAAIKFLKDNSTRHPKAYEFKNAGATIQFLDNVYKWFSIHDVNNRTQHIYARNPDKEHFYSIDDERLDWLENEFLQYLSDIKMACLENNPPMKFLSDQTYEAIEFTTKSTVECVKYLLNSGFYYVLTRNFNSDSIESFFSNLRQMGGSNDMMDVRSTIFALEKILKVGVIQGSRFSNANEHQQESFEAASSFAMKARNALKVKLTTRRTLEIPDEVSNILQNLLQLPEIAAISLKNASVAFVAGFILKTMEVEFACDQCLEPFRVPVSLSPLLSLIKNQDRGGLNYPSTKFVSILLIIQNFVEAAVKILPTTNIKENLKFHILPKLTQVPILTCNLENHQTNICNHICNKFLSLLLKNIAKHVIFRRSTLNAKPLSRKVLKLT